MPPRRPGPPALPLPRTHFYAFADTVYELSLHEPGTARRIPERLLQELWLAQRFDAAALTTTDGTPLRVLDPGRLNTDSGPDFIGARVRIGTTEWAGSVEVHPASGGWFDHRHHRDPRYNAVVLHVALEADIWTGTLRRADGTIVPELILLPHLGAPLRRLLHGFYTRPRQELPCAAGWAHVPAALRDGYVETLAGERMAARQAALTAGALEDHLHERLFAGLGYAKNTEAMRLLARRVPLALARRLPDPLDREALHLGAAGLLPSPADLLDSDRQTADYVMALRERFERLNHRLALPVMERTTWLFFRLRPANFPPLRIAQAVALLHPDPPGLLHDAPLDRLRRALAADRPVQALRALLRAEPTPFWRTHVRLERATRPRNPAVGRTRADALLVNAVAPVLLADARLRGDAAQARRVREVLRRLPAPSDEVTRRFTALGTAPTDALAAQGLHQLYQTRCRAYRCLTCPIGRYLLEQGHP